LEDLLAVVGLKLTTEGIRTGTGTTTITDINVGIILSSKLGQVRVKP